MTIIQLLVNSQVTAGQLEKTGKFQFSNSIVKSRLKEKRRGTAGIIGKIKLKKILTEKNYFLE